MAQKQMYSKMVDNNKNDTENSDNKGMTVKDISALILPNGAFINDYEITCHIDSGLSSSAYLASYDQDVFYIEEYLPVDYGIYRLKNGALRIAQIESFKDYEIGKIKAYSLFKSNYYQNAFLNTTNADYAKASESTDQVNTEQDFSEKGWKIIESNNSIYFIAKLSPGQLLIDAINQSKKYSSDLLQSLVINGLYKLSILQASGQFHRNINANTIYLANGHLDFLCPQFSITSNDSNENSLLDVKDSVIKNVVSYYWPALLNNDNTLTVNDIESAHNYQFATTLYFMLTERPPVDLATRAQFQKQYGQDPVIPLSVIFKNEYDSNVLNALDSMMAIEPSTRRIDFNRVFTNVGNGYAPVNNAKIKDALAFGKFSTSSTVKSNTKASTVSNDLANDKSEPLTKQDTANEQSHIAEARLEKVKLEQANQKVEAVAGFAKSNQEKEAMADKRSHAESVEDILDPKADETTASSAAFTNNPLPTDDSESSDNSFSAAKLRKFVDKNSYNSQTDNDFNQFLPETSVEADPANNNDSDKQSAATVNANVPVSLANAKGQSSLNYFEDSNEDKEDIIDQLSSKKRVNDTAIELSFESDDEGRGRRVWLRLLLIAILPIMFLTAYVLSVTTDFDIKKSATNIIQSIKKDSASSNSADNNSDQVALIGNDFSILDTFADEAKYDQLTNYLQPPGSNIYKAYYRLLESEPNNEIAISGVTKLTNRYYDLTTTAIENGNVEEAQKMMFHYFKGSYDEEKGKSLVLSLRDIRIANDPYYFFDVGYYARYGTLTSVKRQELMPALLNNIQLLNQIALENNDIRAKFILAYIVYYGVVVDKDETAALNIFTEIKADMLNLAEKEKIAWAIRNVGIMYENGWSFTKNEEYSIYRFLHSALSGDLLGSYLLSQKIKLSSPDKSAYFLKQARNNGFEITK